MKFGQAWVSDDQGLLNRVEDSPRHYDVSGWRSISIVYVVIYRKRRKYVVQ